MPDTTLRGTNRFTTSTRPVRPSASGRRGRRACTNEIREGGCAYEAQTGKRCGISHSMPIVQPSGGAKGEPLPPNVAYGKDGGWTTDAAEALAKAEAAAAAGRGWGGLGGVTPCPRQKKTRPTKKTAGH